MWILLPMSYEDEDYLVCRDYADILENTFWKENIIIWDIYELLVFGLRITHISVIAGWTILSSLLEPSNC